MRVVGNMTLHGGTSITTADALAKAAAVRRPKSFGVSWETKKRPVRVPLTGCSLYLLGMTPLMDWAEALGLCLGWFSSPVGRGLGRHVKGTQISPLFLILF
jgi:hypothetical protein